ncbi:MAG: ATP-binding cassette domain-containing protein [Rhodococcus sp.]|nr:ATP-binding cassette domain-containing protein [Rhodococcus sp. (in: high G+C Gram-positive bacteria)]
MTAPSANVPYTSSGTPPPGIVVDRLTKTFADRTVVSDLSFSVPPGTITGFLGPNGSGKTTTLGMLVGLVRPSAGTAYVDGVPFGSLGNPSRVVGVVLDARGAHPKHTAATHLRVYCAATGVPDSRAGDVLDLVGLSSVARRRIGEFSLGMRQRLALATALLGSPRYLVLDEPANGLDPEGMAWLRDFLVAYARGGGSVLVSSHILREVEQMADRLVIISDGRLVAETSLHDLREQYRSRVLLATSDPVRLATVLAAAGHTDVQVQPDGRLAAVGVAPDRIASLASDAGVQLFGTSIEHVDLEQVFLAMTSGRYTAAAPPGWGAQPTPTVVPPSPTVVQPTPTVVPPTPHPVDSPDPQADDSPDPQAGPDPGPPQRQDPPQHQNPPQHRDTSQREDPPQHRNPPQRQDPPQHQDTSRYPPGVYRLNQHRRPTTGSGGHQ